MFFNTQSVSSCARLSIQIMHGRIWLHLLIQRNAELPYRPLMAIPLNVFFGYSVLIYGFLHRLSDGLFCGLVPDIRPLLCQSGFGVSTSYSSRSCEINFPSVFISIVFVPDVPMSVPSKYFILSPP